MANHVKVLELPPADRAALERQMRSKSSPAKHVERARIVLLSAEGLPATAIAERVGCSRPTAIQWRQRYERGGLDALADAPRSGAPRRLPEDVREVILATTLAPPPTTMGITHWSSRLLGRHLDVSHMTVARVWRHYGLQPWRQETFKFSTDPELEAKVRDIVGLYLNPPEAAVVLCVDEKSQIQALDRTAPMLPLRPGQPERRTHDYKRNGTTTLFAALEVATGKVTDACYSRHRHTEFLKFLKQVARAYPDQPLHIVVDNYSAHKHAAVKRWLKRHRRVQLHFTPTSGSWLNLVEVFFSIITRQAIRRGAFPSVAELVAAIRRFIDAWNDRCEPFTWTKDPEVILVKANRQDRTVTGH